jgi:hypothetical protein
MSQVRSGSADTAGNLDHTASNIRNRLFPEELRRVCL